MLGISLGEEVAHREMWGTSSFHPFSNPVLLTIVFLKGPPRYNCSYLEVRSNDNISEQFTTVFQMVFVGCLQLYSIFIAFFFFSFSLISIYGIVEHEEEVPVKLKPIMDSPLDRAACLFPRFQWSFQKGGNSLCDFFSLSFLLIFVAESYFSSL